MSFDAPRESPAGPGLDRIRADLPRLSGERVSHGQRLTLLAAILGSAVAAIDGSIVNVALPAIERDLGGGLSAQQWVSNAYLLTLGSLILIGGSLGDIYGERRIFTLGLAGFGVSPWPARSRRRSSPDRSAGCQGAAAALLTPASLAIIVAAFGPKERGAAIGSWTAWGGIAAIIGPLAGGWIVDALSWRWIFALNVPLVIGTILLVLAVVPRRRRSSAGGSTSSGRARCARARRHRVRADRAAPLRLEQPVIAIPLVGGRYPLACSWPTSVVPPEPMLKLDLFARRNFAVGNLETLAMYAGIAILFFYLTIYLQEVAGYSALESGLATVPVTIVMFMLSRRFGALADRYGPRLFMGAGPLIAGAGIFLLARMGMNVDYVTDVLPAMLIFAIGLSLTVAPLTATILADADQEDAGIASAVNNAVARIAGLIGVSIVGIIVAGSMVGDTFAANAESCTRSSTS